MRYNNNIQYFKNIPLRLIVYTDNHFKRLKAKRFMIEGTNQNIWIPNSCLFEDGTIKSEKSIEWIFKKQKTLHKLELCNLKIRW